MSEAKEKLKARAEVGEKTKLDKNSQGDHSLIGFEEGSESSVVKKKKKEDLESPVVKKKKKKQRKHSEESAESLKKTKDVSIKILKKKDGSKRKTSEAIAKVNVVEEEEALVPLSTPLRKKKASTEGLERKGKKTYNLPGQKHDPPNERDPLRIFYESLYTQCPASEMAEIWMMEHGLLAQDIAKKAYERKKKNQASQKLGSPVKEVKKIRSETKSSTAVLLKSTKKSSSKKSSKKSTKSNDESKPLKVKRVRDSGDDEDDDFLMKPKKVKTNR